MTCAAVGFAVEGGQEARVSDLDVRIAGFAWLRERGAANGGVLPGMPTGGKTRAIATTAAYGTPGGLAHLSSISGLSLIHI